MQLVTTSIWIHDKIENLIHEMPSFIPPPSIPPSYCLRVTSQLFWRMLLLILPLFLTHYCTQHSRLLSYLCSPISLVVIFFFYPIKGFFLVVVSQPMWGSVGAGDVYHCFFLFICLNHWKAHWVCFLHKCTLLIKIELNCILKSICRLLGTTLISLIPFWNIILVIF